MTDRDKDLKNYAACYKLSKYTSYNFSFDKTKDKECIDLLDSLPRGARTEYVRALIMQDIERVRRMGKYYQYAHPRDAKIKKYMKEHKKDFMRFVAPDHPFDYGKDHYFTHSIFVDLPEAQEDGDFNKQD